MPTERPAWAWRQSWPARLVLELRIVGPAVLLPAALLPLTGALLLVLMHVAGRSANAIDGAAGLVLEGICPLGAAIAVVTLVGRDRAMEVILASPTAYGPILLTRAALVSALGALASLLVGLGCYGTGVWPTAESGAAIILGWAAPMVWLGGVGLLIAVAARSAPAAAGVVGGLWLAEILGTDTLAANSLLRTQYLFTTHINLHGDAWVINRMALLAVGAVALAVAGGLLAQPAPLLAGEAA